MTLWLLRAVVTMFLLVVLAQPVLAGRFLSGEVDAIGVHALNAGLVIMLAMAMSAVALLFWTVGRGRFWPLPVAVAAFFAASFQTGFGYDGDLRHRLTSPNVRHSPAELRCGGDAAGWVTCGAW